MLGRVRHLIAVAAIAISFSEICLAAEPAGQVAPPPLGKVLVYLYRIDTWPVVRMDAFFFANGVNVGTLAANSYTWFYLPEGSYRLEQKWDLPKLRETAHQKQDFTARSGSDYFFRLNVEGDIRQMRWSLARVAPSTAGPEISKLGLQSPANASPEIPRVESQLSADASTEQIRACLEAKTAEAAIARCSAVVDAGSSDSRLLAKVHLKRGYAWHSKRDFDRAITEYSGAISLDPENAQAYMLRASIRDAQGDYEGAIADYSQSIRLNPNFASAYNNRACAFNAKGEFEKATADLEVALRLDPNMYAAHVNRGYMATGEGQFAKAASHFARGIQIRSPSAYDLLWHYVAQMRSDTSTANASAARATLEERSAKLSGSAFSQRVIDFYLGRIDEQKLRSYAESSDNQSQKEQACLVDYFLGQWHLIRGDSTLGNPMLQAVASNCPVNFHERWAASLALRKDMGR